MSGLISQPFEMDGQSKLMAARARAAASRHLAEMAFSERTRQYLETQAIEWEKRAESLAAAAPNP